MGVHEQQEDSCQLDDEDERENGHDFFESLSMVHGKHGPFAEDAPEERCDYHHQSCDADQAHQDDDYRDGNEGQTGIASDCVPAEPKDRGGHPAKRHGREEDGEEDELLALELDPAHNQNEDVHTHPSDEKAVTEEPVRKVGDPVDDVPFGATPVSELADRDPGAGYCQVEVEPVHEATVRPGG